MSTSMLLAALRAPIPDPEDAAVALMVRQLQFRARDAAEMIERLAKAVREANDLDITERATDDELEDWRARNLQALGDAEAFW